MLPIRPDFRVTHPPGLHPARLYQSARAAGNLTSERITSREVGYLLNVQRYGLLLDAKVFSDGLTSLISERTNLAGFAPTNNGSVNLRGAELQAALQWSSRWSAFANYAYLDNRDSNNPLERTQHSRHSGSIGTGHSFGAGWQGSIAYYGASGDGIGESRYGRLDLTASKSGHTAGLQWTTSLALKRLDNRTTSYSNGSANALNSQYADRFQVYGQIAIRLP